MSMDLFSLKDKVAIVTGAGRGIGRAIALGMSAAGAILIAAARTKEQVEATAAEINNRGGKAKAITADVGSKDQVDRLVNETFNAYGKIDILVNNAGATFSAPLMEMSEVQWDQIIAVNLKSVFLCSQAAGRIMMSQKGGAIVNIASVVGMVAQPVNAAYASAKAGIINLTKTMATALAPYNIRVNGIAPGLIITPGLERMYNQLDSVVEQIPLGRGGRPEDIVGGVIYLASDASLYVTGETIVIDGGVIIKPPLLNLKQGNVP